MSHRVAGVFSWLSVVVAAEELKLTRANANGADSGHEEALQSDLIDVLMIHFLLQISENGPLLSRPREPDQV